MTAIVLAVLLMTQPQGGLPGGANAARIVGCGGFPLQYGTTIGSVGPNNGKLRARSIIAVAAIASARGDAHARAWIAWDERSTAWLGIAKNSPADLQQLWSLKAPPSFAGGVGTQVRFSPLTRPLPPKYDLVDCPDALPYGT